MTTTLDTLADHMKSTDVARVCDWAAKKLIALRENENDDSLAWLVAVLEVVARRMDPIVAERVCEEAILLLLKKTIPATQ